MRKDLALLQERHFNSKNLRFNRILQDYKDKKISTEKFYSLLAKYVGKINANPEKYNNLFTLRKEEYSNMWGYTDMVEKGKKIHYRRVAKELQEFVGVLKAKLPYQAYNFLLKKTDNFSRLDELYIYLSKFVKEYNIKLEGNYPNLNEFFAYIDQSQSVNPILLLKEERRLVEDIRIGLSQDVTEVEISFMVDFFNYFEDYMSNHLTAEDYEYFVQRIPQFKSIWARYTFNNRIQNLAADFPMLDEFYKVNDQRNQYFLKNMFGEYRNLVPVTEQSMDANVNIKKTVENLAEVKEVVVIVTGGFHTEGLEKLLNERGISYLEVTPNVTQDTKRSSEVYMQIAKQQAKILANAISTLLWSAVYSAFKVNNGLLQAQLSGTGEWVTLENNNGKFIVRKDDESKFLAVVEELKKPENSQKIIKALKDAILEANIAVPDKIDGIVKSIFNTTLALKVFRSEGINYLVSEEIKKNPDLENIAATIIYKPQELQRAIIHEYLNGKAAAEIAKTQAVVGAFIAALEGIGFLAALNLTSSSERNDTVGAPLTADSSRKYGQKYGYTPLTNFIDEIFVAPFRELTDFCSILDGPKTVEGFLGTGGHANTQKQSEGLKKIIARAFRILSMPVLPDVVLWRLVQISLVLGHAWYNLMSGSHTQWKAPLTTEDTRVSLAKIWGVPVSGEVRSAGDTIPKSPSDCYIEEFGKCYYEVIWQPPLGLVEHYYFQLHYTGVSYIYMKKTMNILSTIDDVRNLPNQYNDENPDIEKLLAGDVVAVYEPYFEDDIDKPGIPGIKSYKKGNVHSVKKYIDGNDYFFEDAKPLPFSFLIKKNQIFLYVTPLVEENVNRQKYSEYSPKLIFRRIPDKLQVQLQDNVYTTLNKSEYINEGYSENDEFKVKVQDKMYTIIIDNKEDIKTAICIVYDSANNTATKQEDISKLPFYFKFENGNVMISNENIGTESSIQVRRTMQELKRQPVSNIDSQKKVKKFSDQYVALNLDEKIVGVDGVGYEYEIKNENKNENKNVTYRFPTEDGVRNFFKKEDNKKEEQIYPPKFLIEKDKGLVVDYVDFAVMFDGTNISLTPKTPIQVRRIEMNKKPGKAPAMTGSWLTSSMFKGATGKKFGGLWERILGPLAETPIALMVGWVAALAINIVIPGVLPLAFIAVSGLTFFGLHAPRAWVEGGRVMSSDTVTGFSVGTAVVAAIGLLNPMAGVAALAALTLVHLWQNGRNISNSIIAVFPEENTETLAASVPKGTQLVVIRNITEITDEIRSQLMVLSGVNQKVYKSTEKVNGETVITLWVSKDSKEDLPAIMNNSAFLRKVLSKDLGDLNPVVFDFSNDADMRKALGNDLNLQVLSKKAWEILKVGTENERKEYIEKIKKENDIAVTASRALIIFDFSNATIKHLLDIFNNIRNGAILVNVDLENAGPLKKTLFSIAKKNGVKLFQSVAGDFNDLKDKINKNGKFGFDGQVIIINKEIDQTEFYEWLKGLELPYGTHLYFKFTKNEEISLPENSRNCMHIINTRVVGKTSYKSSSNSSDNAVNLQINPGATAEQIKRSMKDLAGTRTVFIDPLAVGDVYKNRGIFEKGNLCDIIASLLSVSDNHESRMAYEIRMARGLEADLPDFEKRAVLSEFAKSEVTVVDDASKFVTIIEAMGITSVVGIHLEKMRDRWEKADPEKKLELAKEAQVYAKELYKMVMAQEWIRNNGQYSFKIEEDRFLLGNTLYEQGNMANCNTITATNETEFADLSAEEAYRKNSKKLAEKYIELKNAKNENKRAALRAQILIYLLNEERKLPKRGPARQEPANVESTKMILKMA